MEMQQVEKIVVTGPLKVSERGIRTVSYMLITDDGTAHALRREVSGDRSSVRKLLAKFHKLPEEQVTFHPHYDDSPEPDFSYEYRQADYELGLTRLKTQRFSTGAAGTPNDLKWGSGDQVWFTGSANCVGRLDRSRALTVFRREVGHMPTLMHSKALGDDFGWRFLDPDGRRIGFVSGDGKFGKEIELEQSPIMFGPNEHFLDAPVVATDGGKAIDLEKDRSFKLWTPTVAAIGLSGGRAWQISGSRLIGYFPDHSAGERWQALKGGESGPGAMFAGRVSDRLIYMDPGRDVIGFVEDYDKLLEVKLPPGTGIRAMHVITEGTIWLTGKKGQSLFRLDRKRTLIEYPCVSSNSDLFQLDHGPECLWFTEPKHNSVTFADISNL